uniref:Uncharacterized protein n=1 Tax=Vespula pensylvanica TaxID=30213 RepID=A0A834U916_VESPE|nr:hypothetical protein H0235_008379 [Vespula pensylvanica]
MRKTRSWGSESNGGSDGDDGSGRCGGSGWKQKVFPLSCKSCPYNCHRRGNSTECFLRPFKRTKNLVLSTIIDERASNKTPNIQNLDDNGISSHFPVNSMELENCYNYY